MTSQVLWQMVFCVIFIHERCGTRWNMLLRPTFNFWSEFALIRTNCRLSVFMGIFLHITRTIRKLFHRNFRLFIFPTHHQPDVESADRREGEKNYCKLLFQTCKGRFHQFKVRGFSHCCSRNLIIYFQALSKTSSSFYCLFSAVRLLNILSDWLRQCRSEDSSPGLKASRRKMKLSREWRSRGKSEINDSTNKTMKKEILLQSSLLTFLFFAFLFLLGSHTPARTIRRRANETKSRIPKNAKYKNTKFFSSKPVKRKIVIYWNCNEALFFFLLISIANRDGLPCAKKSGNSNAFQLSL